MKKALTDVVTALEAEIATAPESKVNPVTNAAKAASNGSNLPAAQSEPQAAVPIPSASSRPTGGAPPKSSVRWVDKAYTGVCLYIVKMM